MLAPMLASIHNLHYYLNLMREIREALDAGRFAAFAEEFRRDRVRGRVTAPSRVAARLSRVRRFDQPWESACSFRSVQQA